MNINLALRFGASYSNDGSFLTLGIKGKRHSKMLASKNGASICYNGESIFSRARKGRGNVSDKSLGGLQVTGGYEKIPI